VKNLELDVDTIGGFLSSNSVNPPDGAGASECWKEQVFTFIQPQRIWFASAVTTPSWL